MKITDIQIYRDGGSIEFFIERDGNRKRVWLETPFAGEPRALLIDSNKAVKGGNEAVLLSADIEEWWTSLGDEMRGLVRERMYQQNISWNPDEMTLKACELGRVRFVGDYIAEHHT